MADNELKLKITGDSKSAKDAVKGLGDEVTGLGDEVTTSSKKSRVGFSILTSGAVAASAAVLALVGVTLKLGASRALAIEDAKNSLEGLGYEAGQIENVMQDVLGSVKGTAFGLDEAMTVAVGALASGVNEGQALERHLSLVGDAAVIAKTSFAEMGNVFGKVQATGKLTGDVLNELGTRGIPILVWLAEEYGVTEAAMREMVSSGQVDAQMFKQAIETNIGGAALNAGNTARGAFANMQAAMGRVGAEFVDELLPSAKEGMGGITDAFDSLGPVAERAGKHLGKVIDKVILPALNGMFDTFDALPPVLQDATVGITTTGAAATVAAVGLNKMGVELTWIKDAASAASKSLKLMGWGPLAIEVGIFTTAIAAANEIIKETQAQANRLVFEGESFDELAASASDGLVTWGELKNALEEYGSTTLTTAEQNQILRRAHDEVADASDGLTDAIGGQTDAAMEAARAADELVRAMDGQMVAADSLAGKTRTITEIEFDNRKAVLDLKDARLKLVDVQKDSRATADDVARAQLAVEEAELRAADAAYDLAVAASELGVTSAEVADNPVLAAYLKDIEDKAAAAGAKLQAAYEAALRLASAGDRSVATVGRVLRRARGGINPGIEEDITWGEDGAEAIIPLSQKYAGDANRIFAQVAGILGKQVSGMSPSLAGGSSSMMMQPVINNFAPQIRATIASSYDVNELSRDLYSTWEAERRRKGYA